MKLAERVSDLKPSLTRQLFDMAQGVPDVVDLTLGDPDIIPPQSIRDAACRAIQEGRTRYSANAGLLAAREAIAAFNSQEYGRQISPDEIVLTVGGMEAIYLCLASLINPGDEVVVPAPYWINYVQMTRLCGGVPVLVPTTEENKFSVTVEAVRAAVTDKTRVLILNSPNNPTGRAISESTLKGLAELACEKDLFVISDEVYRSLLYDGRKHCSISSFPDMKERCAIIDSMSKRFSMTGWRLGYAILPRELAVCITRFQENVAACAPLPSQYAAVAAYGSRFDVEPLREEFRERRDVVVEGISKIQKLSLSGVDGTFYAFVNISQCGLDSLTFATELLKKRRVAVVPGRTYGKEYDGYVRIAFTLKKERLQEALKRIAEFVELDLVSSEEGKNRQ